VKRKHLIPVGTPVLHVHVPVQVRYTCGTCMYTCTPCILTVEYLPKGKITYIRFIHTYIIRLHVPERSDTAFLGILVRNIK
jgi:hypothetical protein